jgi:hypothetical protein
MVVRQATEQFSRPLNFLSTGGETAASRGPPTADVAREACQGSSTLSLHRVLAGQTRMASPRAAPRHSPKNERRPYEKTIVFGYRE